MSQIDQKAQQSVQKYSTSQLNKVHDDCDPQSILIYIAFKFLPILIYLLLKLLTDQYLSVFIVISVLVSCDFWVTKNISGRKLVALRWYSKINEDNEEKWFFETSGVRVPATINVGIFWISQAIAIIFWLVIVLINSFTLSVFWSFLAIFCCVLLLANFLCFLECKGDHQKRVNGMTKRLGVEFFELNEEK